MEQTVKRVWLVGAGSVGSALAAVLYGKVPVTLVGRSPHAEIVKREGLRAGLSDGEARLVPVPVCRLEEMPLLHEHDLVLLTGKIRSLWEMAEMLHGKVAAGTTVVAIQNGMGFEAELAQRLGHPVVRGVTQFGANSRGEGEVRYYPGLMRMPPGPVAEQMKMWMTGEAVTCSIENDFQSVLWNKLVINAIANPLGGILRSANTGMAMPVLNPVKAEIIKEIRAVAAAEGIKLETTLEYINRYFGTKNVPSLVRDLDRGLPTEIDYINGTVVRLGEKHGIPTPVNAALQAMVKCLEEVGKK